MRILVVDDDPVQRQLAVVALKFAGQSVEAVEDGPSALALLARTTFDIALLDHDMPGQTGLQLMMEIRRMGLLETMPVMFVTSRDDLAVIDRAFELGASGFVTKPVNWALMKHELRFVLRAAENERLAIAARDSALLLSATKDQLMNIARHELRTPLNAVIGFGRLVVDSLSAGSPVREPADEMLAAANRLHCKLGDMMLSLDLANGRVEAGQTAEHPAAVIEELLPLWQKRALAKGIELSFENDAPMAQIRVDQAHFADMLTRLVDNALVHGNGARTITVRLRESEPGRIAVAVADNGAGIAPERIAKCHEAFGQGDMSITRGGEGLGLGLHIVARLASLYGGAFDLVSAGCGSGVTATITLPVIQNK
jgi:signal transduction histidine kinase